MKVFAVWLGVFMAGALIFLRISEYGLAVQAETATETSERAPETMVPSEPEELPSAFKLPNDEELQKDIEEYLAEKSKRDAIRSKEVYDPIWTVAPELLERMEVVEREFFLKRNPKLRSLWDKRERQEMSHLSGGAYEHSEKG